MSHYKIQKLASKYSVKYAGLFDFFAKKRKRPSNYLQALEHYRNHPTFNNDLRNLADGDLKTWESFGQYNFKGWEIDDVKKLVEDLGLNDIE